MFEDNYTEAKRKVKKKKGFYRHFGVFIAVGIFFLAMNIVTFHESHKWWFFFPLLPWSVGLFIHYFSVFGLPGTDILTKEWEEREIEKELQKLGPESDDYIHPIDDEDDTLDINDAPKIPKRRRADGSTWEDGDFV